MKEGMMTNENVENAIEAVVLTVALLGAIAIYWQYQSVPDWLIAIIGMLVGLPVQRRKTGASSPNVRD